MADMNERIMKTYDLSGVLVHIKKLLVRGIDKDFDITCYYDIAEEGYTIHFKLVMDGEELVNDAAVNVLTIYTNNSNVVTTVSTGINYFNQYNQQVVSFGLELINNKLLIE